MAITQDRMMGLLRAAETLQESLSSARRYINTLNKLLVRGDTDAAKMLLFDIMEAMTPEADAIALIAREKAHFERVYAVNQINRTYKQRLKQGLRAISRREVKAQMDAQLRRAQDDLINNQLKIPQDQDLAQQFHPEPDTISEPLAIEVDPGEGESGEPEIDEREAARQRLEARLKQIEQDEQ